MTRNIIELAIVIVILVALPLLLKHRKKRNQSIEQQRPPIPDLTDDPTAALARAFPEGNTAEIRAMLSKLGFKFGINAGFVPDATPEHISGILSEMFTEDEANRLRPEFDRYRKHGGPLGQGNVQLAVLRLSAANPDKLRMELSRAKADYRDVVLEAESMQQFIGSERPLAPGVTDRSDQVFREYVLWLCRWLLPTESRASKAR